VGVGWGGGGGWGGDFDDAEQQFRRKKPGRGWPYRRDGQIEKGNEKT